MISFREFLSEARKRDPAQFHKIIYYIQKRQGIGRSSWIHQPEEDVYPQNIASGGRITSPDKLNHSVQRIPLKHIQRTQDTVDSHNVLKIAADMHDNRFDEEKPEALIHLYKTGNNTYSIVNGHHRYFAAKLNKRPDILANVWEDKPNNKA